MSRSDTLVCSEPTGELASCAAKAIRETFPFGFVGISLIPKGENPVMQWGYADGSTNKSYELIRLPASVGALGKVHALRKGIIVNSVEDDIPENELFQYPIVMAEALKSFFAFPLMKGDEIAVIIICGTRFLHTLDDHEMSLIQRFAAKEFNLEPCKYPPVYIHGDQQGFAYNDLSKNLLIAQEAERKRIARELHDGISQEILVAQMELRRLKYLPQSSWPELIEKTSNMLRDVMSHISAISRALRPLALDELGLSAAVEALCESSAEAFGITVVTNVRQNIVLNGGVEIAVYRIFQEALNNACKYSDGTEICVSLDWDESEDSVLVLTVSDNGKGFDVTNPDIQGSGLGLKGMKERAMLVGGILHLESHKNQGSTVVLRVKVSDRL